MTAQNVIFYLRIDNNKHMYLSDMS